MKYLCLILSLSLIISMESGNRLVFVYNAKSGVVNGIFDYVHKFVSPSTYSCNLCSLTYDNLGKKNEWANYLNNLSVNIIFAYKDNINNQKDAFLINYSDSIQPPCLFIVKDSIQIEIINSTEMNKLNNLDELKVLLNNRLIEFNFIN